jgi:hypothetical protein
MDDHLLERVRLILLRDWDPIGITKKFSYNENAEDEYDRYASCIFNMITQGASRDEIFDYLKWVATERMGLSIFQEQKARHVAELIMQS